MKAAAQGFRTQLFLFSILSVIISDLGHRYRGRHLEIYAFRLPYPIELHTGHWNGTELGATETSLFHVTLGSSLHHHSIRFKGRFQSGNTRHIDSILWEEILSVIFPKQIRLLYSFLSLRAEGVKVVSTICCTRNLPVI